MICLVLAMREVWGCALLLFTLVRDVVVCLDCGLIVIGWGCYALLTGGLVGCCVTCA